MQHFAVHKDLSLPQNKHFPAAYSLLRLMLAAIVASIASLAAAVLPWGASSVAYAEYTNPSITTIAQVNTDASLHVVEQRAYALDEAYGIIEWQIPDIDTQSRISVSSVRALKLDGQGNATGEWKSLRHVPFRTSWSDLFNDTQGVASEIDSIVEAQRKSDGANAITPPKSGTFAFDNLHDRIYIFPRSETRNIVYECDFTISDAVRTFDDIGELYWKYACMQGDMQADNIQARIQIPVPENALVEPGRNVYAWGHGPEGSIEIRPDGVIVILMDKMNAGQYAEAHVAFPRRWLTNISMRSPSYFSGTRLDNAIAEEDGWTDIYSASKANACAIALGVCVTGMLAILLALALYAFFGREKAPSETVTESMRRAILGRLLRWNQHSAYDLADTLEELKVAGVIQIIPDASQPDNVRKTRLRLSPSAKTASLDNLDKAALAIIFDTIGDGYQSVSISDIEAYCKKNPSKAVKSMKSWQDMLTREVTAAGLFDQQSRKAANAVYIMAALLLAAGILCLVFGVLPFAAVCLFASAIICACVAYCMPRRTPKGVDAATPIELQNLERESEPEPWKKAFANAFGDALTA